MSKLKLKWEVSSIISSSIVKGFLSDKALLRCISPFLKSLLDDICPCSSVSIVLPDVDTQTLRSFTDWIISGCAGSCSSEWNEILTLLGMGVSHKQDDIIDDEKDDIHDEQEDDIHDDQKDYIQEDKQSLLLRKFQHLKLNSPQLGENKNSSETDMFLTDDESFSVSVCKAAQCDLSAEEEDISQQSEGQKLNNETVYEDCREQVDDDTVSISEEMKERSAVPVDFEDPSLQCSLSRDEASETENNQLVQSGINDPQFGSAMEGEDNSGCSEEEADDVDEEEADDADEDEDDFSDESETDESSDDPSWDSEDSSDSIDSNEEEERAVTALPGELCEVDQLSLSVCLSEAGPVKLHMNCGCRGACVRNCRCRTAGQECSSWCGCDRQKCKSKLTQRQTDGSKLGSLDPGSRPETPNNLPPPLSASTAVLTETQRKRNKKKLFTEKLGPQEI